MFTAQRWVSLDQHVRDVLRILRDLGRATTLLGHSYGGYIAWEVARAAPEALASLILVFNDLLAVYPAAGTREGRNDLGLGVHTGCPQPVDDQRLIIAGPRRQGRSFWTRTGYGRTMRKVQRRGGPHDAGAG